MLRILEKPLIDVIHNYDVVLIPMNINSSWSSGIRYEVALNFPYVREKESTTNYCDKRKYGTIYTVECDGITFCMCYMYKTKYKKHGDSDTVDYDALEKCLHEVCRRYSKKKICLPMIGCSQFDGNGNREQIERIVDDTLKDIDADVFVYEQRDYKLEMFHEIAKLHKLLKNKEINGKEYIKRRSEVEWRRRYGIFKKMPENYTYIPRKGEVK